MCIIKSDVMSRNMEVATRNRHHKNNKFVTVDTVGSMLTRNHKGINFEPSDLIEWCRECLEEIADPDTVLLKKRNVEVRVNNSLAELPCDVYRLLSVRVNGSVPTENVIDDGDYLHMNFQTGKVKIDYYYLPETRDGIPVVSLPARQACYWYCLIKIKADEYERGLITEKVWDRWNRNYDFQISRARGSFKNMSRDDLNQIMAIMFNWVNIPQIPRNHD